MYSIHENRHFMYDSYTIHPVGSIDLRRGCLFLFFTFMSRSSFAHFHFSLLIHFPYFLSIDLFIHMSRRLLTTSADAHIYVRSTSFAFLHIKSLNIANKTQQQPQMQMQKGTRNVLFICKNRYERKSGPAYLFPQLVIYHIIVIMPNETCNMNT